MPESHSNNAKTHRENTASSLSDTQSWTDIEKQKLQDYTKKFLDQIAQEPYDFDKQGERAEVMEENIREVSEKLEAANDVLDGVVRFLDRYKRLNFFSAPAASSSLFVGIAIAGVNVITTPILYTAAFILGGRPKIAATQVSNWIYSGLVLGTTIAIFLVPGLFPILSLVMALGAAGIAMYSMAQTYQKYKYLQSKSSDLQSAIQRKKAELEALKTEAQKLCEKIEQLCGRKPMRIADCEQALEIQKQLIAKEKDIHENKAQLHALQEEQTTCEKDKNVLHISEVVHKGVEVLLAGVGLVGAVTTLLFPPVGIAILASAAFAGGAYVLARVTYPWIKRAVDWVQGKKEAPAMTHVSQPSDVQKKVTQFGCDFSTRMMHQQLGEPCETQDVSDPARSVSFEKSEQQNQCINNAKDGNATQSEQSDDTHSYGPHH